MATPQRILIVEDEESILKALNDKIRKAGYEVTAARQGADGLARALKEHPDLILLDIIMPIMGGIHMLEELRKDAWGATAKVLILTNLSDADALQSCKACDVHDYLIKAEWTLGDLLKKIASILRPAERLA